MPTQKHCLASQADAGHRRSLKNEGRWITCGDADVLKVLVHAVELLQLLGDTARAHVHHVVVDAQGVRVLAKLERGLDSACRGLS